MSIHAAKHVEVAVDHDHMRADADGHLRGVCADDAAAEDDHLRRRHARRRRRAGSLAAVRLLQAIGAGLDRHAACDLGHRRQQRQPSAGFGDGFVGDAEAPLRPAPALRRVGRQMQVGEEDLALAQHRALVRLRLLDLDDHVGCGKDLFGVRRDRRADLPVVVVGAPMPLPAPVSTHHLVAAATNSRTDDWCQADTVLVVLDFLGYADVHFMLLVGKI